MTGVTFEGKGANIKPASPQVFEYLDFSFNDFMHFLYPLHNALQSGEAISQTQCPEITYLRVRIARNNTKENVGCERPYLQSDRREK